jgi:cytochrome c-type biogenesis protein CcmH/NrfG
VHAFDPSKVELNGLGYRWLNAGRLDEALAVFRLNVDVHPDYANGWDSLGETLFRAGEHEAGMAAYRRAYELDPTVGNAAAVVERAAHR